jgi:dehydrogenase/reductase SDR family protein 4
MIKTSSALALILSRSLRKEPFYQIASMTTAADLGKYKCKRLEGKVAVVTASTAGIGLAIAERLGHEGAHVVVSSRKQDQVNAAVTSLSKQGLSVTGLTCHVGNGEDRKKLFQLVDQKFGGLDILVSNAGINPTFGQVLDTKEEAWQKIFDVNVKASFMLCKEAVPLMEKKGGGAIVIVSSIGGYDPFPLIAAYSISKTALLGLVKGLAPQCAGKHIRINAIAPGIIKTKFSEQLWNSDGVAKDAASRIPLNRFGTPEECAGAAAFLVSDDASFITGETIVMSGGVHSRL